MIVQTIKQDKLAYLNNSNHRAATTLDVFLDALKEAHPNNPDDEDVLIFLANYLETAEVGAIVRGQIMQYEILQRYFMKRKPVDVRPTGNGGVGGMFKF